ncbi:MAG: cobalamin biosynthesis protein [Pseudotabrizicola sp.]|uniref:cobalamin biosynthesis protein n=1 Tax=Pseudotabrizicola sp. TaxID=2939647 RepID=UPI0027209D11|nr:cobalamin biosynthesis protein [Pseudotabrizicola sp.]MDO8881345.1 cobalamin biosynthesis protein [Pseudotabrizicola sp.]MDP2080204.1 cobalamin biosynthesis protein [Pseudotabrizicola sp.]MDZ7575287.1 cobalamin biosynthesis protein [Pseudotabrizicola sp.]
MRVAGIGYRDGAPPEALHEVLALAEAAGGRVDALATLAEKVAGVKALAEARGLPVLAVAVAGVQTPTQSPRILAMHGTGSVAEAAALVAAGPGAGLVVARITARGGMATCAIAETRGHIR